DKIQASFGRHDVTGVKAFVGGPAAKASDALGAKAYASGDKVAFANQPDLHTAAHEAAHTVQQRAGVQLKGNLGSSGDKYERQADRVADLVVQGKWAQPVLDQIVGAGSGTREPVIQRAQMPGRQELQGSMDYLKAHHERQGKTYAVDYEATREE